MASSNNFARHIYGVALLASFGYVGHILEYAPHDNLICRLATT
ncbi:TPA: hypothetical protein ACLLFU_000686 [Providencia stuartii]